MSGLFSQVRSAQDTVIVIVLDERMARRAPHDAIDELAAAVDAELIDGLDLPAATSALPEVAGVSDTILSTVFRCLFRLIGPPVLFDLRAHLLG